MYMNKSATHHNYKASVWEVMVYRKIKLTQIWDSGSKFFWTWNQRKLVFHFIWSLRNNFIFLINQGITIIFNHMNKIWRSWWVGSFKPGRKKPIKDFIEKSITTLEPPQVEQYNLKTEENHLKATSWKVIKWMHLNYKGLKLDKHKISWTYQKNGWSIRS